MFKMEELDVSTPSDKAVFYSGEGNDILAKTFTKETGKMTIEETAAGKKL